MLAVSPTTFSVLFDSDLQLLQTPQHAGTTVRGKELGMAVWLFSFLPSEHSAIPTVPPHQTVSLLPSLTLLPPNK